MLEGMIAPVEIFEVGIGSRKVTGSFFIETVDCDKLLRLGQRQRTQKGLISDIENCCGRANSQCQGQHGSNSESGIPSQHAQSEAQIAYEFRHESFTPTAGILV